MSRRGTAAALALCAALAAAHALWFWPEVVDDAYITFRYARHLALGHGLVFNPGDSPVEGFSSPSWMLLSALAIRLGAKDLLLLSKLAGLLLHVLGALAAWALVGAPGRRRRAALLAPLAFATLPYATYHAVGGMETPLATACLAGAGLALASFPRRPGAAAAGLAAALVALTLTRPEGFGYAAALLAAGAIAHRRNPAARRAVTLAAAAWILAWAALLGWRWITFGALVPNTALAKAAGPQGSDVWWRGLVYVGRFFRAQYLPTDTLLALAAAAILLARRRGHDARLALPLACACGFSIAVRGDWMHGFRFLVPAAPFFCALLGRAAVAVEDALARRGSGAAARAAAAALGLLATLFVVQNAGLGLVRADATGFGRTWKPASWPLRLPERVRAGFDARLAGVSRWAIEHVAPGQRLATGDIGFPAWVSEAWIVDLAGLTDRGFARSVTRGDAAAFGERLRARDPDWIVLRLASGKPAAVYDRLLVESGALDGYAPRDTLETYGRRSLAVVWARRAGVATASPPEVAVRYGRAFAWNPRVRELRRWRAEFLARNPELRPRPQRTGPTRSAFE